MWSRLGAIWAFSSDARAARVLFGFACAEAQSELELRLAARLTEVPRIKALYLRHALDEARHSGRFFGLARELAGSAGLASPRADSEELFERLGEARFIAFVHFGERRGRLQFEAYARALEQRRPQLARAFAQIASEELHHERYTHALLLERVGKNLARRALLWVRAWESFRRMRRFGRGAASFLYAASMSVVYLSLWPLARTFARARPSQRGFDSLD